MKCIRIVSNNSLKAYGGCTELGDKVIHYFLILVNFLDVDDDVRGNIVDNTITGTLGYA
jgi:hypothetical protein